MHILVGVCDSKHARAALEHAVRMTSCSAGHTLYLCFVHESEQRSSLASLFHRKAADTDTESTHELDARAFLEDFVSMSKQLENVRYQLVPIGSDSRTSVAEYLVRAAAEHKCDRIVIGHRSGARVHLRSKRFAKTSKRMSFLGEAASVLPFVHGDAYVGPVARGIIGNLRHGCELFVVNFDDDVVEKWPKIVDEERLAERYLTMAEEAGYAPDAAKAIVDAFFTFDTDKSGSLDVREVANLLDNLQMDASEEAVHDACEKVDGDFTGTLDFGEFVELLLVLKEKKAEAAKKAKAK